MAQYIIGEDEEIQLVMIMTKQNKKLLLLNMDISHQEEPILPKDLLDLKVELGLGVSIVDACNHIAI
jgi:hypothetical protein